LCFACRVVEARPGGAVCRRTTGNTRGNCRIVERQPAGRIEALGDAAIPLQRVSAKAVKDQAESGDEAAETAGEAEETEGAEETEEVPA